MSYFFSFSIVSIIELIDFKIDCCFSYDFSFVSSSESSDIFFSNFSKVGEIVVLDLVSMISLITNQDDISDELMYIIDINQDEGFNVLDVVVYVQIIVGRGL